MKIKVGNLVIVKNAWKYDSFAPEKVQGTVYILWQDGDIGVAVKGGSMKVNPKDIVKMIK